MDEILKDLDFRFACSDDTLSLAIPFKNTINISLSSALNFDPTGSS